MRENIITEYFTVSCDGVEIRCRLDSPIVVAENAALLLTLSGDADETLDENSFLQPVLPFLENGHRALTFDLPCHGKRMGDYGEYIEGFAQAYKKGVDIFGQMTREVTAVLDGAERLGVLPSGRVCVSGCSRGGYLALRALAADSRISYASAVCPVTGWEHLLEFQNVASEEKLLRQNLRNFAPQLAGKGIYLAIGTHDDRVSTESCLRFYLALSDENERQSGDRSRAKLVVTEDEEHTVPLAQRRRCGEVLLEWLTK